MKKKKSFQEIKFWDYAAYFSCLVFFAAGSIISVNRYWQFEVFYYDFGIFDRAIWLVSRFQAPIVDHMVVGGKWIFADHFSPSIFLLSPIYWFTNRSEVLLITQSLAVALSGLVIFLIAKKLLKNKFVSLSILSAYFLFVGLQNAIITDIHEVTFATLFVTASFWFYLKKKPLFYFLSLFILLGFKESLFLLGIFLAVTFVLIEKKFTKLSFATFLISVIWGYLSIKVIIPYFSGGFYQYSAHIEPNFFKIAKSLINYPQKRQTIFYSFTSFGFLPVFAPAFWPLIFEDFLTRFYPFWPTRWNLTLHYSAILATLLAISSIYGLVAISAFKTLSKYLTFIVILLILVSLYLYRFKLNGPFGLFYNPAFYSHTKDFGFLEVVIKQVPQKSSVMAPNNLASHFTHQKVWLLRKDYKEYMPDYILIDTRLGQSPNNYFYTYEMEEIPKLLNKDVNYELVYTTGEQFVYKKR